MSVIGNAQPVRYTKVAIALHWMIAALIAVNLAIGWWMEDLVEPYRTIVVRLHQSSGITVLALTIARIGWRLAKKPPPLDAGLSRSERITASCVHAILYLAMLGLPLSGWALISANPPRYEAASPSEHGTGATQPQSRKQKFIMVWGVVPLLPIAPLQNMAFKPNGVAKQHVLHERIVLAHAVAGYLMLALIVLHVLGALKHQILDKKPQLYRMGIGEAVIHERVGP